MLSCCISAGTHAPSLMKGMKPKKAYFQRAEPPLRVQLEVDACMTELLLMSAPAAPKHLFSATKCDVPFPLPCSRRALQCRSRTRGVVREPKPQLPPVTRTATTCASSYMASAPTTKTRSPGAPRALLRRQLSRSFICFALRR